jgi:hypothetical protein
MNLSGPRVIPYDSKMILYDYKVIICGSRVGIYDSGESFYDHRVILCDLWRSSKTTK